ncbi:MAG: NUDIX domain-containing protein [Crocinitomicaceae bacterium]|nr:NUDIX domain-containing protein [Crocinitomicaceae bacterium]
MNSVNKNKALELNPNVSVDCVIFGFDFDQLHCLLIDSGLSKTTGRARLAVPGDLIYDNETLDEAANRVLKELTGIDNIYLEQVGAFGDPNRMGKESDKEWLKSLRAEPDARVITVAYFSLVKMNDFNPEASSFAESAGWAPIKEIDDLAFDHSKILDCALGQLKRKIKIQPIGFNLLPQKFTLSQLHKLYESILNKPLDKRNFRRKILNLQILTPLNEKQVGVPHKPSQLFEFNEENYQKLSSEGFDNFGF